MPMVKRADLDNALQIEIERAIQLEATLLAIINRLICG